VARPSSPASKILKELKKQLPFPEACKGSYCFQFSAIPLPLASSSRAPSSFLFLNFLNNLSLFIPFKSIPAVGSGKFLVSKKLSISSVEIWGTEKK